MDERKRLIRNTGIIAVGNVSTKMISFLLLPMYTSLLTSAEYGIFDYIVAISTFVVPFITMLMDESMFRFLIDCKTEEEKKKCVSQATAILLMGVLIFVFICTILFSMWDYEYAVFLVLYVLSCTCCSLINPLLRGFGQIKAYTMYNFVLSALTILFNVLLIAVFRMGLQGMFIATIVAHFGVSAIFAVYAKIWKYLDFRKCELKSMKEMLVYSFPLIPNKLSWTIINMSDRIVIMNILSDAAAGLYAVAHKFPNLMDTIYGFFYQSWKESSARILETDGVSKFYNEIYLYVKRIMFSVVLCMIAFLPIMFKVLINENFNQAILYVPPLILATYFANVSGFYGGIFTAYKDTKIMGTSTVIGAIINLIVHLCLIWKIGLWAAAISPLLSNIIIYLWRKKATSKYVILEEKKGESFVSFIVLLIVIASFYVQNNVMLVISCFIALTFSFTMNKKMIKGFLKKH